MNEAEKASYTCGHCHSEIQETDDFCPHCGSLFEENISCEYHPEQDAEGVCIICHRPYCRECGSWANRLFLCSEHESYEIYEGMVRVFGTNDEPLAQYAVNGLRENGLNPFLFCRRANPMSFGGFQHSMFQGSGVYDTHLVNELKVMVPCHEVRKAEQVLRDLDILK